MDDIMKKMEERNLTYEEYEEILKKIDPVYAYVVSLINTTISNSPEHGKYY